MRPHVHVRLRRLRAYLSSDNDYCTTHADQRSYVTLRRSSESALSTLTHSHTYRYTPPTANTRVRMHTFRIRSAYSRACARFTRPPLHPPARYGGARHLLVCDETPAQGASSLAVTLSMASRRLRRTGACDAWIPCNAASYCRSITSYSSSEAPRLLAAMSACARVLPSSRRSAPGVRTCPRLA